MVLKIHPNRRIHFVPKVQDLTDIKMQGNQNLQDNIFKYKKVVWAVKPPDATRYSC